MEDRKHVKHAQSPLLLPSTLLAAIVVVAAVVVAAGVVVPVLKAARASFSFASLLPLELPSITYVLTATPIISRSRRYLCTNQWSEGNIIPPWSMLLLLLLLLVLYRACYCWCWFWCWLLVTSAASPCVAAQMLLMQTFLVASIPRDRVRSCRRYVQISCCYLHCYCCRCCSL